MTITSYVRRPLTQARVPATLSDLGRDAFEGYASLFGVPDGAGDVVQPGAFAASLRRRPAREVRMLYQHLAHEPIGVWEAIREDAKGLYVRGRLTLDVVRAREVRALIADGALDGLSIGFRTVRARRDAKTGLRRLDAVELWEISIVTFPLLKGSGVTGIGEKNHAANAIRGAAHAIRDANHLPLVGRSKRGALRVGGGSSAPATPHPKNPSDFSTSPRGGG
jgi:HK97 family phage prohead protease